MSQNKDYVKQLTCGRRKPNMTRKEYNDHRFQVHGKISDADPDASPMKYIQTPIFDAAFGAKAGGLNRNHTWVGRDDVTELTYRDWAHLKQVFLSDHVKTKVGPDAVHFADLEATVVVQAIEHLVELPQAVEPTAEPGYAVVATYFLSTSGNEREGSELRKTIEPKFLQALQEKAGGEVWRVEVNVGTTSTEFDINAYFGGSSMPNYALVYKVFLKSEGSVPYIRQAQKTFEKLAEEEVDFSNSFIVFGNEALVMDASKGIKFDGKRQPVFKEEQYAQSRSHLSF